MLSLLSLFSVAHGLDFFCSPSGSDTSGTGTASSPWRTPLPALAATAAAKDAGGLLPSDVTIQLASGSYFLPSTLAFTAPSCGDAEGHSVTVAGPADPLQPPATVSGGVPIPAWSATSTPGVYSAPMPPATAALALVRQVWDAATGLRYTLARTPIALATSAGQWGVTFAPGALGPADLPTLAEAELVIWHNWVTSQNKIAAVSLSNHSVSCKGQCGDPFFGAGGNIRYALQNVANPSTLAPGSFYVAGRTLYLRPAPGSAPGAPPPSSLIAEALPEVVTLTGTAAAPCLGVTLTNLTLAHAAADLEGSCMPGGCGGQSVSDSTTAALHAQYAQGCSLVGVEVAGTGAYGVWWDAGSVGCSTLGCWLHDLGMGGVRVGNGDNSGSTATAPARNVSVEDCEIEQGGLVAPAGTGVLAQEAYGTSIVHNHIHHLFYTGVGTGWTWGYAADSDAGQTVGWNHIHHIFQRELSDGGCVYNLGRSPGTFIINNVCHDVDSYGYGGWGLYTDEGSSNVTVVDNIVYDTKDSAFHQHYGTDNLITNNIFAYPSSLACDLNVSGQCDQAAIRSSQHMDCGLWAAEGGSGVDYGCNSSFTFEGNIVLLGVEAGGNATKMVHDTFCVNSHPDVNGLKNMTWGRNVYWSEAFGQESLLDVAFGIRFKPLNFSEWQKEYKDTGSAVVDPLFVDAPGRNFTLLPNSPALAMGFQNIDVSTVGPRAKFRRAQ